MTTQEMHIDIDLGLQKINSFVNKSLLSQEKDWFLNREVNSFLKKRTNFANYVNRVEDIRDLVRVKSLPIEKNSRGKYFIELPSDYFGYVRFDGYSYYPCSNTSITPTNIKEYSTVIDLNIPDTTLTSYKVEINIGGTMTTIFDIDDLPANYLVQEEFKKQKFLLMKAMKIQMEQNLKKVLSPNLQLYWEFKGYDYSAYTLYLTSDADFNSIIITSNGTPNTFTKSERTIESINLIDTPLRAKIRLIDNEFLSDVENSHLSKSRANSPLGVFVEGVLEVSKPFDAILGTVDITYICKPNIIDLLLDSNLNMSRKVSEKIVSNTIQTMKAIINDTNYQAYVQENVLTE